MNQPSKKADQADRLRELSEDKQLEQFYRCWDRICGIALKVVFVLIVTIVIAQFWIYYHPSPVPAYQEPPASRMDSQISRGGDRLLGVFEATAYCEVGPTKTGSSAGPGVIAVDPSVIPLGSQVYVEGYGQAIAVDTGRLIKSNRIDVWMENRDSCLEWGRKSVRVWIQD